MIAIVDFGKHIMGHCFVIIKIWSVKRKTAIIPLNLVGKNMNDRISFKKVS